MVIGSIRGDEVMSRYRCSKCEKDINEGAHLFKVRMYEIVDDVPDMLDLSAEGKRSFCSVECLAKSIDDHRNN